MGIMFEGDSLGTLLGATAKPPYDLRGGRRVIYFFCYTHSIKAKGVNKESTDGE